MRIESSNIQLYSEYIGKETKIKEESLKIWAGTDNRVEDGSQMDLPFTQVIYPKPKVADKEETVNISDEDKRKIMLLEQMLESILGKKVKLHIPETKVGHKQDQYQGPMMDEKTHPANVNRGNTNGFGLHYHKEESYQLDQSYQFSAQGNVKTASGESLTFNFNMAFSSTYSRSTMVDFRAGEALKDPLVVHLKEDIPSIHNKTLLFDLKNNGELVDLPFFNGSGYLSYDRNKDGVINNGSELFGPNTNNGFMELMALDQDQNGWLDENDQGFSQLSIWLMDQEGNQSLQGLINQDVGAIYLGNVSGGIKLYHDQEGLQGQLTRMGIYLKENGSVGQISHVDLKL